MSERKLGGPGVVIRRHHQQHDARGVDHDRHLRARQRPGDGADGHDREPGSDTLTLPLFGSALGRAGGGHARARSFAGTWSETAPAGGETTGTIVFDGVLGPQEMSVTLSFTQIYGGPPEHEHGDPDLAGDLGRSPCAPMIRSIGSRGGYAGRGYAGATTAAAGSTTTSCRSRTGRRRRRVLGRVRHRRAQRARSEHCIIGGEQFFIRGCLVIPVIDAGSVPGLRRSSTGASGCR